MVYEISTVEDFINFWGTTVKANTAETSEMVTGKLMNHIDFIGTEYALNFPSFGGGGNTNNTGTKIYNITFDGNNKRICNFSKIANETYYALFGEITLYNSLIKDLYIDNAVITCDDFLGIVRGNVNTEFNNVVLRNFNITANTWIYVWNYSQIGGLFYKCAMVNSTFRANSIYGFGCGNTDRDLPDYKYCVSNVHFIAKNYIYNHYISGSANSAASSKNGVVLCCVSKDIYEGAQTIVNLFHYGSRIRQRYLYNNYCYCASRFVNCANGNSSSNPCAHIWTISNYNTACFVDSELATADGCIVKIGEDSTATTSQLKDRSWLKQRGWVFA